MSRHFFSPYLCSENARDAPLPPPAGVGSSGIPNGISRKISSRSSCSTTAARQLGVSRQPIAFARLFSNHRLDNHCGHLRAEQALLALAAQVVHRQRDHPGPPAGRTPDARAIHRAARQKRRQRLGGDFPRRELRILRDHAGGIGQLALTEQPELDAGTIGQWHRQERERACRPFCKARRS